MKAKWVLSLLLLANTGCATLLYGGSQQVAFESTPPGARVEMDGRIGITPCTLTIERRQNARSVLFILDGFKPYSQEVSPHENWGHWAIAIICAVNPVSAIVDVINLPYRDWPEKIEVKLEPKGK